MDIGAVESESEPPAESGIDAPRPVPPRRLWPVLAVVLLGFAGGFAWALHAGAIHL